MTNPLPPVLRLDAHRPPATAARATVDGLSLDAGSRRDRLPARPVRLRQDDGAALHRRLRARRRGGEIRIDGETMSGARPRTCRPSAGASAWCSRTTRCSRTSTSSATSRFGLRGDAPRRASACDAAARHRRPAPRPRTAIRTSSPAASSSASRWPARSRRGRALLLLDEPFSNLDVEMRERLGREVRDILKDSGTTAILVTHDQHEAFAIADEIGVMADGRIEQWRQRLPPVPPAGNRFVADFIGQGVFVDGTVLDAAAAAHRARRGGARRRRSASRTTRSRGAGQPGRRAAAARRHPARRREPAARDGAAQGLPRRRVPLHAASSPSGAHVLSLVPSHHNHAIGEAIGIRLEIDHLIAFPKARRAMLGFAALTANLRMHDPVGWW